MSPIHSTLKSRLLTLLAVLGISCMAVAARADDPADWRDRRDPDQSRVWDRIEGRPAPTLNKLNGWLNTNNRSWNDYRGKVVLLDYWATWCGPCVAGIPHLEEMYAKYKDRGFEILGVHSARGFEEMPAFVEKRDLEYTFAADPTRDLGEALGIRFIPSYFFIDRSGRVRVAGANRDKLDEILESLLAEDGGNVGTNPGDGKWPEPVKKKLYGRDYRGKKAPELQVAEWIGRKPMTGGKIVLVDFWATWCGPCRKLIPELNEFQKEFRQDLVVIGVSDEETTTVREFMNDNRIDYSMGIDTMGRAKKMLGVEGIPHVIIISTDGVVRWQGFPGSAEEPLTADIIRQIISADPGLASKRNRRNRPDRDRDRNNNDNNAGGPNDEWGTFGMETVEVRLSERETKTVDGTEGKLRLKMNSGSQYTVTLTLTIKGERKPVLEEQEVRKGESVSFTLGSNEYRLTVTEAGTIGGRTVALVEIKRE